MQEGKRTNKVEDVVKYLIMALTECENVYMYNDDANDALSSNRINHSTNPISVHFDESVLTRHKARNGTEF